MIDSFHGARSVNLLSVGTFNGKRVFCKLLEVVGLVIFIGGSFNPIPGRGVVGGIGFYFPSMSNGAVGESLFVVEFSKEDVLSVELGFLCSAGARDEGADRKEENESDKYVLL